MDEAKILIVDDDPDITEAMKIILENKNYSVSNAGGIEPIIQVPSPKACAAMSA